MYFESMQMTPFGTKSGNHFGKTHGFTKTNGQKLVCLFVILLVDDFRIHKSKVNIFSEPGILKALHLVYEFSTLFLILNWPCSGVFKEIAFSATIYCSGVLNTQLLVQSLKNLVSEKSLTVSTIFSFCEGSVTLKLGS